MKGEDGQCGRQLNSSHLVDTFTTRDPFLAACRAGVPCTSGLGMLVHQAACVRVDRYPARSAMRAAVMAEPA
jgi:shikimate 5-dehydrogenase